MKNLIRLVFVLALVASATAQAIIPISLTPVTPGLIGYTKVATLNASNGYSSGSYKVWFGMTDDYTVDLVTGSSTENTITTFSQLPNDAGTFRIFPFLGTSKELVSDYQSWMAFVELPSDTEYYKVKISYTPSTCYADNMGYSVVSGDPTDISEMSYASGYSSTKACATGSQSSTTDSIYTGNAALGSGYYSTALGAMFWWTGGNEGETQQTQIDSIVIYKKN